MGAVLVEEGADLLDIGAESTRPGASSVDEEEEMRRLVPIVTALHEAVYVPISVDTSKAASPRPQSKRAPSWSTISLHYVGPRHGPTSWPKRAPALC